MIPTLFMAALLVRQATPAAQGCDVAERAAAFTNADTNLDLAITQQEIPRLREACRGFAVDGDGDGKVSFAEFLALPPGRVPFDPEPARIMPPEPGVSREELETNGVHDIEDLSRYLESVGSYRERPERLR